MALVTLAPELPGALEVVGPLVRRGVVVSAGHSGATAGQARAAVDAGVSWVTHLWNAMRPMHHREPGPIVALLEDPRVTVELGGETGVGVAQVIEAGTADDRLARELVLAKYSGTDEDLGEWGRTALPVAIDLPSDPD